MKGEKFSLMKVTNRVLDDIEEIWMDGPPSEAESVPKLYGDLMKMLGFGPWPPRGTRKPHGAA